MEHQHIQLNRRSFLGLASAFAATAMTGPAFRPFAEMVPEVSVASITDVKKITRKIIQRIRLEETTRAVARDLDVNARCETRFGMMSYKNRQDLLKNLQRVVSRHGLEMPAYCPPNKMDVIDELLDSERRNEGFPYRVYTCAGTQTCLESAKSAFKSILPKGYGLWVENDTVDSRGPGHRLFIYEPVENSFMIQMRRRSESMEQTSRVMRQRIADWNAQTQGMAPSEIEAFSRTILDQDIQVKMQHAYKFELADALKTRPLFGHEVIYGPK